MKRFIQSVLVVLCTFAGLAEGTVRYVSSFSGSDAVAGTSPSAPCRSIQRAVDVSSAGDEIRIAKFDIAGFPPTTNMCTYLGTNAAVVVLSAGKSVSLKGGYVYVQTGAIWQQGLLPPLVDGQGARRCLYAAAGDGNTNRIELLEFANGSADRGGDVYAEDGNVQLVGTPIHHGVASVGGGGVYLKGAEFSLSMGSYTNLALPQLSGVLPVYSNTAPRGGGVFIESGYPVLGMLGLYANRADGDGGGACIEGGYPSIVGGIAQQNLAGGRGGAFYLTNSVSRIAGMNIVSNSGALGGAFFMAGPFSMSLETATLIANNYIRCNVATGGLGGGFYFDAANVGVINNVIANNAAATGSAAYLLASSSQFYQNTIADNAGGAALHVTHKSGAGQWIVIKTWMGTYSNWVAGIPVPSWPAFTNTILSGHGTALYVSSSSNSMLENKVSMGYTLWTNIVNIAGAGTVLHHHDFYGDPQYTNSLPYHLTTNSPAIDTGTVVGLTLPGTDLLLDIDGQFRPSGNGMDLGADEVVPLNSYSAWFVPAGYDQTVRPGQVVTNVHRFLNSGDLGDTYTFSSSNTLLWSSQVAPTSVILAGQSITTVTVVITVPGGAADGDENTTLVKATSTTTVDRVAYAADVCTVSTNAHEPTTRYVWLDSPTPGAPYDSRQTAGHEVQSVVDVCNDGDTVIVVAGVYDRGGKVTPGYALTNRVCVTNAIVLQGESGPSNTFIMGAWDPVTGSIGSGAVRCVYMTSASELQGFTLANGYVKADGNLAQERSGGGVWMKSGGVVSNCVIAACRSVQGGGAYLSSGGLIQNTRLERNLGEVGGGAYCANGGVVQACVIVSNQGSRIGTFEAGGGGVFCNYGGAVSNSDIVGNQTGVGGQSSGGGVFCYGAGRVDHCRLLDNRAQSDGGGVYLGDGGQAINCLIVSNEASYGGGINFYANSAALAQNCAVVGNTAYTKGGGMYFNYGGTAVNCIVYYNTAYGGAPDVGGPLGAISRSCATRDVGFGQFITNEPRFVNPPVDCRLMSNSPCLDMGDVLPWMAGGVDLDGNVRIVNGFPDMGAYEFQGIARGADADADGLENAAERAVYLTDPTNADTDGDRMRDGDEIVCDTSPTNAGSYFHITDTRHTNSHAVTFSCTNSRVYSLQVATNLVQGAWVPVSGATNRMGDVGGIMSLTDTVNAVFRSYRVDVSMP